jgi:hypothetical protein
MQTFWRVFPTLFAILLPRLLGAQSPVSVSLAATPNPSVYGAPVTLTATIAPSGATGRVTFYDGVTVLGIGTFTGGQTSLTTIMLASGTRQLWAHYSGASGYSRGDSAPLSQVVTPVSAGALQPNGLATVGTKPVAIAAGDLNGDGKVDLVVANGDGTISVLLGSGTGTFAPAVAYTAGVPTSLALGDFNGDGKLDVAVSNGGNSTVSILLGNGDGTFQPMGPGFPVGRNPVSLVAGDFNGDGNVDLATANFADGTGSVLLGNGDGTFGPALTLTAASGSDTIAIADFNGDGFADLAVENRSAGNLSVFLGKGDGTFQAAVQYHAILASSLTPAEAAAAALNGDTLPDLALSNSGSAKTSILAVDIDGDGLPDLAMTSATGDAVAVLMGSNSDFFNSYGYGRGASPVAAVAGDFNGDGRVDLAVLNGKEGKVSILLGSPPSQICCSRSTRTVANRVALAPSNVSVSPNFGSGTSATFTFVSAASGGSSIYSVGMLFGTPVNPSGLETAPTSSCFIKYFPSGNYFILFDDAGLGSNTGAPGSFGTLANSQCSANLHFAGVYLDDGGNLVIVVAISFFPAYQGTQGIWMQTEDYTLAYTPMQQMGAWTVPFSATAMSLGVTPGSSTFGQPVRLTAFVSPTAATGRVTFYDGGNVLGDAPIVSGTATLSTVALAGGNHSLRAYYPGNATYALAGSPVVNESVTAIAGNGFAGVNGPFSVGTMPVAIAVADVNADGLADLIVANEGSNNISVLLGNRGGGFSPASGSPFAVGVPDAYGYLPDAVAVGDFNGDGKPDLAIANKANRMVWLLFGDGTGAFTPPPYPYYAGAGPDAMVAADFNGDGNTDLAVANYADGTIQVLPGNGAGGFGLPVRITFGLGIPAIAAGDFNGDGYADLAVADVTDGKVWILLGNSTGVPKYQSSFAAANVTSIAVADFNVDGKTDLAFTNSSGVTVMLGDGTGTFNPAPGSPSPTGSQPSSVAVGDFNGDGVPDLAVANQGDGTVSVLLGNGKGGFSPMSGSPFSVGAGSSPAAIVVGDFNGDGRADLAVGGSAANNVIQLLATPCLSGPATLPTGAVNQVYPATTLGVAGANGALIWSATGLPAGLSIDPSSGTITGTPLTANGSPFLVQVTAIGDGLTLKGVYSLPILSLCDLSQNLTTTVTDVQAIVNEVLGVASPVHDLNGDGVVNIVDIQLVVNAAIGFGCLAN